MGELVNFSRYLTVKEAAKFLGIAESTIRNWDRSGKLSAVRHPVNSYRLYAPDHLVALLNEMQGKLPRPDDPPFRIMLIEDNPQDAALIIRAFRKNQFTDDITVISDGAAALNALAGASALPDLILLDLNLPKVGGLEVLRQIKSTPRTQAIPIVALTSSREEKHVCDIYRLGGCGYLVKAVDAQELTASIKTLCAYWLTAARTPNRERTHERR